MKQAGTEIWRQSGGGRWNEKTSLEVLHLKTTSKKIIHLCLVTFHTVRLKMHHVLRSGVLQSSFYKGSVRVHGILPSNNKVRGEEIMGSS